RCVFAQLGPLTTVSDGDEPLESLSLIARRTLAFLSAQCSAPARADRSARHYETVMPPSTAMSAPVIADDAGEHSHAIDAATSRGSMSRPTGCCVANDSPLSSPYTRADASRMAVRVEPGLTALAVTPYSARSMATPRISPTTACFAAEYAT